MSWWEAVILGILQGASEFLPISSSGHLLLLEKLGVGEENLFFNIMLHVGTLAAVLIVMRSQWLPLVRRPKQKKTGLLLVACLPTIALALIFRYCFPSLTDGDFLALGFMLSAVLLFASEKLVFAQPTLNNYKISTLTGIMQGIAVLPGVSRSGSTISAMRLMGINKSEAANFSFLLSIPIILGSALFEILSLVLSADNATAFISHTADGMLSIGGIGILPLVLGVTLAFISGFIAMRFFLTLIKKHTLTGFAIYDGLLGVLVLILLGLKII